MPVWKYSDKGYLKVNDKRVTDYAVDESKTDGDIEVINFTKYMPYTLNHFINMNLKKETKNKFNGIQFLKLITNY